ncbi:MFS transporter [Rhizobium sp. XQZ8]|uniref:MFS transporter n=1 Tax=Rhizobium populisoli TaxID=2859785 RepID=UPI001CA5E38A|nr:MFS transporter [Rhizobium populisoli]MBW6421290.1 MFS transporter [Rhizobium populisoli]
MTNLLPASPSNSRMTTYSFLFSVLIGAGTSAVTPLYHVYQELFHLSPAMITFIFGSYAFALLATLLTLGGLSDYVGRKPLILLALLFNVAALTIFIFADSGPMLLAGRIVQGFATGVAFPTLGATILDGDKARGSILNSISPFLGLMIGTLAAGALVAFAPEPTRLVYALLLLVTIAGIVMLPFMPETTSGRPGALKAMKPNVSIPRRALGPLLKVTPLNVASWALGGFYLSLMPTLVAVATGITSPFVGATVVSTMMLTATASVFIFKALPPRRVLFIATNSLMIGVVITLFGVQQENGGLLFAGTAIAGLGFGSTFANVLKIVLPLAEGHERAGLFSAFLVESYLAFSVPAIVAGLAAPVLGLSNTAYLYGAVIIALALISIAATRNNLVESPAAS